MKKIIVILFSAALGVSFLFIGFGSYLGQSYVLKVGKNKISESEFLRELDSYKLKNELNNLTDQEEIYHRIQFINQYINDLLFTSYLADKTFINDNSKKVILKKSLNNDEMFRNLDESTLQNYLKEISKGIDKDLFNNSLEPINLVNFSIKEDLLKTKQINIYEILDTDSAINYDLESEFFENYQAYQVDIEQYDLLKYINENIINEELALDYYNENSDKYSIQKKYSYEQIISNELSDKPFDEIKNLDSIQFKDFDQIKESIIIPNIKNELAQLEIGKTSKPIQIADKYFYLKLINTTDASQKTFTEVYDEIKDELSKAEIDSITDVDNLNNIQNYQTKLTFYSNSFNFLKFIPVDYHFLDFNSIEGLVKNNNFLYKFSVSELSPTNINQDEKNNFLTVFTQFKNQQIKEYTEKDLNQIGTVNINYFTDSLSIKNIFLEKENLEKAISIKKDQLVKIILPNEVLYLKLNSISQLDDQNIKQNIINLIYSKIIDQLRAETEIEVNNQLLLKQ